MNPKAIEQMAGALGPVIKKFVARQISDETRQLQEQVDTLGEMVAELEAKIFAIQKETSE